MAPRALACSLLRRLVGPLALRREMLACLAGAVVAVAGLSGCAATSITSQVQSFGQWPQGRKPSTFAFDVLPSQQAQLVSLDKLQAAALPALQSVGFTRSPPGQADRADVLVQLSVRSKVEPRVSYQPYGVFGPYAGAGFYAHPYPLPYAHPYGRPYPYWRGAWGGPVFLWSPAMEPPWVTLRVEVILRDRRSSQVLYETHASHDRLGAVDESVLPYLFQAALQAFPETLPGPRVVDIPLPQKPR